MKSTLTILLLLVLCFERALGADLETKGAKTNESKWSVDFLIVDETGTPLPNAKISVAYLNPTPNDRNLEFDPKRNLSQNLKLLEGVNEP